MASDVISAFVFCRDSFVWVKVQLRVLDKVVSVDCHCAKKASPNGCASPESLRTKTVKQRHLGG